MKLHKGFTMIELMIVVAIVAILAAISIPAYNDYVTRSKITEATSTLSSLRVRMEQYYQDNRSYVTAAGVCGAAMPVSPAVKYFSFTCVGAATTYLVIANGATGSGSMAGFIYTIDQSNNKQTTAAPAAWAAAVMPAVCWITKKGGTC
jgi:type IV pilus assembly protein PilE